MNELVYQCFGMRPIWDKRIQELYGISAKTEDYWVDDWESYSKIGLSFMSAIEIEGTEYRLYVVFKEESYKIAEALDIIESMPSYYGLTFSSITSEAYDLWQTEIKNKDLFWIGFNSSNYDELLLKHYDFEVRTDYDLLSEIRFHSRGDRPGKGEVESPQFRLSSIYEATFGQTDGYISRGENDNLKRLVDGVSWAEILKSEIAKTIAITKLWQNRGAIKLFPPLDTKFWHSTEVNLLSPQTYTN
jgi:hypothetical protein